MSNLSILIYVILILWVVIYGFTTIQYDSTDSKELKKRSGMSLYIDYETGNQYIKCGLFGQATLRLDKDGQPLNYYKDTKWITSKCKYYETTSKAD